MNSEKEGGWRNRLTTMLSRHTVLHPSAELAEGEYGIDDDNDDPDDQEPESPTDTSAKKHRDFYDPFALREIEVGGKTYEVPQAIKATDFGWRARWRQLGYARQFWRFEYPNLTREKNLTQAKAWLAMRHPREFIIEREALDGGNGRERLTPRFRIMIENFHGQNRERWMSEKLSGLWFITQDRIDEAIEKMHRRLDHYEIRRRTMPHMEAIQFKIGDVDPNVVLYPQQKPMSLKLHDLLAWTGEAEGFLFNPPDEVAAGRTQLYWPELEGQIQDRCPTITADLQGQPNRA